MPLLERLHDSQGISHRQTPGNMRLGQYSLCREGRGVPWAMPASWVGVSAVSATWVGIAAPL